MDPDDVAKAFVGHYYRTFDSNRAGLGGLYQDASMLTFEGDKIQGAQAIVGKLMSLPFQQCVHNVSTIDPPAASSSSSAVRSSSPASSTNSSSARGLDKSAIMDNISPRGKNVDDIISSQFEDNAEMEQFLDNQDNSINYEIFLLEQLQNNNKRVITEMKLLCPYCNGEKGWTYGELLEHAKENCEGKSTKINKFRAKHGALMEFLLNDLAILNIYK
ncbi:uncharacterized protein A4U43_C09F13870 [Asparagus officinalis]|uniref:NTF2 domain-containing protein n=1 Tax=Asparagus officinalis TaxID=4686 RepID=A0A5P1EAG7_ASPOF|nr:uncharacterized protein A4U43_C09F13870 [Asparagus officinalis]